MIPRLPPEPVALPLYEAFCAELRAREFAGDLSLGAADRTVLATDNSIYQVAPGAVAFPHGLEDLVRIAKLLGEERFAPVRVAPRGGGTGTNGQSLTDGLVVDLSRHMNRILKIDPESRTARVEAGVVKDQLNAALKPHGLFFAPELSTSNRATIGGMISTDACGQGSCLYGKTRDHVLELTTVLSDGTPWHSRPLDDNELAAAQARADRAGAIHRGVDRLERENAALVAEHFPRLNRSLTGYDLAHIRRPDGRFDLNAVLCGSEGTLGFLAQATLNVLPLPSHAALVNLRYASFDAALRDAQALVPFGPASVETVDSTVLALAQDDLIWAEVAAFFPADEGEPPRGVNLIEFVGQSEAAVEEALGRLTTALDAAGSVGGRRGYTVARSEKDVQRIWEMRKRSVGLLGNLRGEKRPIPFVEDTAVPPENLADYIADFRAALDRRGLDYGMFGHVDAGVLHVRPAVDMKAPGAEALIREVTEEVVALTQRYGGLLWGEHGKGVRSEFSPRFFGPLYPVLQAVKAAFDPRNQFNPGKIAVPDGGALLTIDGVPTKGARDRTIPPAVRAGYDEALHCNGNGAARKKAVGHISLWQLARNKYFVTMALVCAGASATGSVLSVWQPQIIKSFGLTNLQTGFVNSIPYGIATLFMVLWGRRSDRSGERTWHTAIPLMLAALGLVYLNLSGSIVTTIAAVSCALVGAYAFKGPFWALSAGWLSAGTLAAGLAGINATANLIGGGLMVNVVGLVKEATGSFALGMLPVAALDAAAAVSVLLITRAHLRETRAAAVAA